MIAGQPVNENEISVNQGWNIIGVFDNEIPGNGITTIPPNILVPPFCEFSGNYQIADNLNPGKGYWVKANASGIIQLNK